jgi:hypothetical protein
LAQLLLTHLVQPGGHMAPLAHVKEGQGSLEASLPASTPHLPYFLSFAWQSESAKRLQSRSQQKTPKSDSHVPVKHPCPTGQSQAVVHFVGPSIEASIAAPAAPAEPPAEVPADPPFDVPPAPVDPLEPADPPGPADPPVPCDPPADVVAPELAPVVAVAVEPPGPAAPLAVVSSLLHA